MELVSLFRNMRNADGIFNVAFFTDMLHLLKNLRTRIVNGGEEDEEIRFIMSFNISNYTETQRGRIYINSN